jgi:D-lactate dehydrogenase (cytochrome)
VEAACNAAIATIQSGIPVARIELLDEVQVRACNAYSKLTLPESPMLFLEFHGTTAGVAEQSERFGEIADDLGGGPFTWTTNTEERTRLWQARHDVYWAALGLRPGARPFATDVCVPLSKLAECVHRDQRDIASHGLIAPIAGHVGDGNFHCSPLIDMDNPARSPPRRISTPGWSSGRSPWRGTCTGEHGVGQGKMKYLAPSTARRSA